MKNSKESKAQVKEHSPELEGSILKHPYMLYVLLTVVLFVFLLLMTWLALDQGWIPNRGIKA